MDQLQKALAQAELQKTLKMLKLMMPTLLMIMKHLPILYDLIENEGLSLGTSCGINIAGAIRMGKELGPGKTIVTILCDKSEKYATKMFNRKFLEKKGLPFPRWL